MGEHSPRMVNSGVNNAGGNPGTPRLFVMSNGKVTLHPFGANAKAALIELALSERSESNGKHLAC